MAIVLKGKKYNKVMIDSNICIGVLGDYKEYLELFRGNVYYLKKDEFKINKGDLDNSDELEKYKYFIDIDKILNKDSGLLSHSDNRLLAYIKMLSSNSKIIVIDEPFLYLDNNNKKKIKLLFNQLIKEKKTIIIASNDTNVIYSLCKKVLLVKDYEVCYENVLVLNDENVLKKYSLDMPQILFFINEARKKGISLPYTKDVRDLIKDVYRNVSKK